MKKHLVISALLLSIFVPFTVATLAHAQATTPAATTATVSTNKDFYTLTQIPAITDIASSNDLAVFFNNLYKYAVGISAALAVLLIMFAGFTWMSAGDNTEKISQAKKRIQDAVFGLILVLSPAIVFGIINPNVLDLKVGLSSLASQSSTNSITVTSDTGVGSNNSVSDGDTSTACKAQNGTAKLYCLNTKTNGTDAIGANNICPTGDTLKTQCSTAVSTTPDICSSYTNVAIGDAATNESCNPPGKAIDAKCCSSLGDTKNTGYLCCGTSK